MYGIPTSFREANRLQGGSDVRDVESTTEEKDLILNFLDLRIKNRGYKIAKVTA